VKQRLEIGGITFETKEAAKRHTSQLLRSLPFGDVADEHVRFLLSLLKRHPKAREKEGTGILGFEVRRNDYGSKGFWVVRRDGTATAFSYRECISPTTNRTNVLSAFRQEIQYQIIRFKRETWSREYTCPITERSFEFDEGDVDHMPPLFVDMVHRFLADQCVELPDVLVRDGDGVIGAYLLDRRLAQEWREFHQKHARLSLLSREGHRLVTRETVAS